MLKRNLLKINFAFLFLLFLHILSGIGYASNPQEKSLQIYANGKSYKSFSHYRSERFKNQMIDTMPQSEKRLFEHFLIANKGFTSINETEFVDYNRFIKLYEEFKKAGVEEFKVSKPAKNSDTMAEMQAMLDGLQAQKEEAHSITLNPSKMKTIVLKGDPFNP